MKKIKYQSCIKTIVITTILIISLFCRESPAAGSNELKKLKSFEKGVLYKTGNLMVIELNGTYKDMGRQYGKLLSGEINGLYDEIIKQYKANNIINSEEEIKIFSKDLLNLYPKRFQDITEGMGETIDRDKLAVVNEFFDFFIFWHSQSELQKNANCSCITLWGDYTKGPLIMGRNFDFPAFYKNFNKYIIITVFNPIDGSHSAAAITYAGQIGAIQSFNDAGLVMENNDGSSSDDKNRYFGERTPFLIKDMEWAFDYSSTEGIDRAIKSTVIHYPLIFNIATPEKATCYQVTTSDVKSRTGNGLLIGTNHFDPALKALGETWLKDNSVMRYNNLLAFAEKHKGTIDAKKVMEILDIPEDKGGATPSDRNIYRFVTVPKELKLWIKIPDYTDWTEVDLKLLFH